MNSGLFITLEGPEGGGKSTQIKLLAERLRANGRQVECTREPGGTPIGEKIRAIILDPANGEMDPLTETYLLVAARCQHVREKIWPLLEQGTVVLSDRFADASVVYQGLGRGVARADIDALHAICLRGGRRPDLTLLLDIPVEQGMARIRSRYAQSGGAPDRLEQLDIDFFRRVREAYLDMARAEPERYCVIDASQPPEKVAEDIWQAVSPRCPKY